jgi:hypothetical protein
MDGIAAIGPRTGRFEVRTQLVIGVAGSYEAG